MDGKDLEGNSHGVIDVLSWYLSKGDYGKLLKFHSEKVLFWPSCSGSQIPHKSRSHLKIWGTKSVKWSKFQTQDPKISGAPTQNVVTQAELSSWTHIYSVTGNITDVSTFLTQATTSHPISLLPILILSSHQNLGLPSGFFLSGFPTKTQNAFLFSPHTPICTWPAHLTLLDLLTPIFAEQHISWSSSFRVIFSSILSFFPS